MGQQFELPVEYKGEKHIFKAVLNTYGYTHKFHVEVNSQTIIFEPDEERNYRAVLNYADINNSKSIDTELIKVITKAIEEVLR